MDTPAHETTRTDIPRGQSLATGTLRRPRRRRPTGAPPPLPHHLQTSGVRWLVASLVLVALAITVFARGMKGIAIGATVVGDAVVQWLNGLHTPGLVGLMQGLAAISSWWVLNGLFYGLALALLLLRRFRHLIIVLVGGNLITIIAQNLLGAAARRPRPFGVVFRTSWNGWALPSIQLTLLAFVLICILYTLVPEGRWRNLGKWVAAGLVTLTALGRVTLGADALTDVLVGAVIGVAVPLVAFRLFAPSEVFPVSYRRGRSAHLDVSGARGVAIRRALEDQLGLLVEEIKPFGLAGSGGSTPLRVRLKGEPASYLFCKLYARGHLRADRWYKLGRELLYGRLEDEKPYNTVRRLVQQEDYALSLMQRAGLPSPTPYGFVELTPEREYLLVTEFFDGATELGDAEVDDQVIDDGLGIIRKLWDAGLAHRDIKPANLLVRDGRLLLIDVAFVEARPSPWRQAVDLANMMLCLALRSSAERVYRRALRQFTVEEISEGFAAARGLALPSQLRRMLRTQGRDLHAEFVRLLPSAPRPIMIQRWSARRVGLLACAAGLAALLGVALFGSFNNDIALKTSLNLDSLSCTDFEPLLLEAQSVPSASMVPCVAALPSGWTLGDIAVNDGRSVLSFDSDRAGKGAMTVRLSAGCDLAGAIRARAEGAGLLRYQRVERLAPRYTATRLDVFPGGCVASRLVAAAANSEQLSQESSRILGLVSRDSLRLELEQRSSGRLHLDPA
jgi:tRNA A-37 threonylcarbamoyl transferase component Bud32/membrane-associated phospholipid phosphatase